MNMKSFKEFRRQRRVDLVVRLGHRLDDLRELRSDIDDGYDHTITDALDLDAQIANLERRTDEALDYIRRTAN